MLILLAGAFMLGVIVGPVIICLFTPESAFWQSTDS